MIKVENLNVKFDQFQALNNINFNLNFGEPMVILGESGAGKTTLAKTLIGKNLDFATGKFEFDNNNLLEISANQWRSMRGNKIALMVQNLADSLNPQLKVLPQIIDAVRTHKINYAQAQKMSKEALRQNQLDESIWHRYPQGLSGGEIQKILLAMALVMQPKFLILDEPTSALDTNSKNFILQRLKKVARKTYMLIITHDIGFAEQIGEKIGILYGGQLLELADKQSFFNKQLHPYSRALLNSAPKVKRQKDLQGINGEFKPVKKACAFSNRCNQSLDICKKSIPPLIDANLHFQKATGASWANKTPNLKMHKLACHRGGVVKMLEVKNLYKSYGEKPILIDINFDLYAGESLVIFGASGSGKSTLAKILAGFETQDSGTINLDSALDVKITIVGQNPTLSLPTHFSVYQTLAEAIKLTQKGSIDIAKKISESLKMLELPNNRDFQKRQLLSLSGGELQRLALARALVVDTKILIADEITSALDVSLQAKIVRLLMQLQEKTGLALMFISHDENLSKHLADRIFYLKNAELKELKN